MWMAGTFSLRTVKWIPRACDEIPNGIASIYGFTTVSGSGRLSPTGTHSQNTGNPSNTVVSVVAGGVMRLNNYIDINFPNKRGCCS